MNLPNCRRDQTKAMQMATHLEKRPMLEVSSTLSNLYIDFYQPRSGMVMGNCRTGLLLLRRFSRVLLS